MGRADRPTTTTAQWPTMPAAYYTDPRTTLARPYIYMYTRCLCRVIYPQLSRDATVRTGTDLRNKRDVIWQTGKWSGRGWVVLVNHRRDDGFQFLCIVSEREISSLLPETTVWQSSPNIYIYAAEESSYIVYQIGTYVVCECDC